MSSTNEGNDDGAREDELDLGQDDEDVPVLANGQSGSADKEPPSSMEHEGIEEVQETDDSSAVDASDLAHDFQEDSVDEGASQLLPHISGSVDGSSIPDDTPSLHVSGHITIY